MTIRQTAIAKLQQQTESLLLEVSNFIDLVIRKHQSEIANDKPQDDMAKVWEKWFEGVDLLQVKSTETAIAYLPISLRPFHPLNPS